MKGIADLRGPYGVDPVETQTLTTQDGVTLVADVYRPQGTAGPLPTLVRRTPYGRRLNDLAEPFNEAHFYASHGYVVVVQDTRGRGDSTGEFLPFEHDAEDGYETIEWAAGLDGTSGAVGTFGQSYGAIVQYLAASLRPPHLVTSVPISGVSLGFANYWYRSGALELGWTLSYFIGMAEAAAAANGDRESVQRLGRLKADPGLRFSPILDEPLGRLPLTGWIDTLGQDVPYLADVLSHDTDGPYWRRLDLHERIDRIDVPMLHIGSWYDLACGDTPDLFAALRSRAPEGGHRLIMGPWAHLMPYNQPTSGGTGSIDFGPHAAVPMLLTQLDWFDQHLRGVPVDWIPPVQVFVMGSNMWREESSWPLERAIETRLYLSSDGDAASTPDGGCLVLAEADGDPDAYIYDPEHPVPTDGGHYVGGGVADQRAIQARPDVAVYTGPEQTAPMEITGPVSVELYASTSARDTDFVAVLSDVHPDGFVQNLAEGIVRGRFRTSYGRHEEVVPGQVDRYDIDLWNVSHVIDVGHRIRLHVTSSDFPRWDRNLNTGESQSAGSSWVVANQRIWHSTTHPSCVVLPVVPQSDSPPTADGGRLPSVARRRPAGDGA